MKGRLAIFVTVLVTVVVLVALNAASYVRVEQAADTESDPDRSTFNSGGTGTRALFEYLRQTGRDVTRWRKPAANLPGSAEAQARQAGGGSQQPQQPEQQQQRGWPRGRHRTRS